MPRPDGEPTNFELIEQGLARLDPETRHHVIQTMILMQEMPPKQAVRVLLGAKEAFDRYRLPPAWTVSSCIRSRCRVSVETPHQRRTQWILT
jgi:hypothetical protein